MDIRKHFLIKDELDRLDETLSWTTKADERAAYFAGCKFLLSLQLDSELSRFAAERLGEIRAKYRLN